MLFYRIKLETKQLQKHYIPFYDSVIIISIGCLCKELQSRTQNSRAFKAVLVTLKATALNLSKIFKYAEGR